MEALKKIYTARFEALTNAAKMVEDDLVKSLQGLPHIDRISARPKSLKSFMNKALKQEGGKLKYDDPINQIQDQIGARIIAFYLEDVDIISDRILRYHRKIEQKNLVPDSEREFGYFGTHFILILHTEMHPVGVDKSLLPNFFELQIKTLFQHAFSEGSHDLAYKPSLVLTSEQKRKVAFTAAQAWGGDLIFNELQSELIVRDKA